MFGPDGSFSGTSRPVSYVDQYEGGGFAGDDQIGRASGGGDYSTGNTPVGRGHSRTDEFARSSARTDSAVGWGQFLNPLNPGGLFGAATGAAPRPVLARADSFTGPPSRAIPFNLEMDDAESVESNMWSRTPIGWVWAWWKGVKATRGINRRGRGTRPGANGQYEYPIHLVHLGNRVTFLPTPLRNWWGRPNMLIAWFACSIYMILVMLVKLGIFYFLSTSLIIFPTAIGGACLGLVGSTRYLQKRHLIGSFDAAQAVETSKLYALLSAMLTMLVLVVYVSVQLAWTLRAGGCNGESFNNCDAQDLCQNWSPCYATAPHWITGTANLILGILVLTATIPYFTVSIIVFRRARAASYYLVDNML
mmetsp:Transcript_300/g.869  ORF Transcript_300/g.869 Transcript_300/m.869 type:complete len:363 (-) Transcript_300:524-1612(-)|eukprot:CAMPEP_0206140814 /NCGR_PEP_ID=MMETSP1473-20131121/10744_1 /ASSEMBLY_ACC=CAM_ASM_001109 /TAXON_ID=1461547 /ORGANISM="Stichococcus sp, Strain RCC1054" /LENGTH=362 /DNA_ID=CAMNT_0053535121 /DNA_START=533 /DNA_END=1621 /DNA_ORIENTATION=-